MTALSLIILISVLAVALLGTAIRRFATPAQPAAHLVLGSSSLACGCAAAVLLFGDALFGDRLSPATAAPVSLMAAEPASTDENRSQQDAPAEDAGTTGEGEEEVGDEEQERGNVLPRSDNDDDDDGSSGGGDTTSETALRDRESDEDRDRDRDESLPGELVEPEMPEPGRHPLEVDLAARPPWVEHNFEPVGPVRRIAVSSNIHDDEQDAWHALYEEVRAATDEYINEVIGNPRAAAHLGPTIDNVRNRMLDNENTYVEHGYHVDYEITMYEVHALLEFDEEDRRQFEDRWQEVLARTRLLQTAMAGGGVLGVLLLLFGYFRLDTASRGFYTGRLQFGTAIAILALIALCVYVARSMPWFWS